MNRRKFAKTTLMAAAAASVAPGFITRCTKSTRTGLMKRPFGKIGFEVSTMGLGGQSSLQWTPEDVDPVKIILKAFDLGINYFDTSNLYGPSQLNFGKAFQAKNLIPGSASYDENLRRSIFLTTKTHLRYAKGESGIPGVRNRTNGESGSHTIDDLRRSLSQMFGDGNGNYPEGAYVDMVLFHNLNTMEEVDAIYEGLDNPDPNAERIGALVALRDYRDGTNLTGLNPRNEKLIRHIGFSGHYDASVNMYMIQRDSANLLDAMLVAINANDKLMFNMQHNVIPLAASKNMGVIAMKVFADGAMYTKPAEWSSNPGHVVRTVGSPSLPSQPLIQYSLTTPGVHLAIIGIGHISDKDDECQLTSNLAASQILPDGLSEKERLAIEEMAGKVKDGKTNYFQMAAVPLSAPKEVSVIQKRENNIRRATISWSSGFAGDAPIKTYEIWRDNTLIIKIPYTARLAINSFSYSDALYDNREHSYNIKVVDAKERIAKSVPVTIDNMG